MARFKEQRNTQTGETRWIPAEAGVSGQLSAPPQPEEARIGPIIADFLRGTRTGQYAAKLPEIYGGIAEDIGEKGLGHYFTPQGYQEQLRKTGQIFRETGAEQIGVGGELAPFFGLGGGALPQQFGKRVLAGAARGGLVGGIYGATGVSPEERRAEEAGVAPALPQAGLERLLSGLGYGAGGAAVGGAVAGVTGIPGLIKEKFAGKITKPRAGLAEAKTKAFQRIKGKAPANLVAKAGDKFAERTPQVQKLNERYKAVLEAPEGMDWVEFGESVSDWGSFGHARDSALKGTPTGRYFATLYRTGKEVIGANAPEAAKLIKIEALTYKVPRLINRWTWQLLKFRGLGRVFGI